MLRKAKRRRFTLPGRGSASGASVGTLAGRGGTGDGGSRPSRRLRLATGRSGSLRRSGAGRSRPRVLLWSTLIVTMLVAGVIFLLGYSRAFTAQAVEVSGTRDDAMTLTALEHAAIPQGRPLARVDTAAVEEAVLQDLRVATVDVGRTWPSTVTVDVTLRQPAAVIRRTGEDLALADAGGVIYDSTEKAPKGVPRIYAPSGELAPEPIAGALAARTALPESVLDEINRMTIAKDGQLRITTDAYNVSWGGPEEPELKARVLSVLLAQPEVEQAVADYTADDTGTAERLEIDLSVPDTPIVTGLPVLED